MQFLIELRNTVLAELGYVLLLFIPPAAVIFTFYQKHKKEKTEAEAPFDEMRRRPAGESSRLQVERLSEQIDPWLITLVVVPVVFALCLTLTKPSVAVTILFFLFCAVISVFVQRKLQPLVTERAAYRLGCHGERYVAEELNQLLAHGFRVFHDVPFEKYNIDHVVVGPSGVFAVETKAKRKKIKDGKERHRVTFDGTKLQFTSSWNVEWIDQARLNAKSLSQWLRASAAEAVSAEAVLTIPGWLVTRKAKGDVHILNPKEIHGLIRSRSPNVLDQEQIQRISHQLEEKCRLQIE